MNRNVFRRLLLACLLAPGLASAQAQLVPQYVGVSEHDVPGDVAVVVANSSAADNGGLKCFVEWVTPWGTGQGHRHRMQRTTLLVLKPGRYIVTGAYTGLRSGVFDHDMQFEAGKRYRLTCLGRSHRSLTVEATEF